jgi:DUF4097 and DUF4098 domain-containing protein YvlB
MTARTDRRVALGIGAVLAAGFIISTAVQVAGWTVGSVEHNVHKVIPGPVRSLTVEAGSGDVTLVPATTGDVTIDSRVTGTLHAPAIEVRPTGARVVVSGGCSEITFGHCSTQITISVPAGTAVNVDAASGDIHAAGLSGNADLRTSSGDVRVSDLRSFSVRLESASGDVEASNLRTSTVRARTASGDIDLQLLNAPDAADAETSSGNVTILVPPGPESYRVDADTDSGDTKLDVSRSARAQRLLRAHTNSGNVTVTYE